MTFELDPDAWERAARTVESLAANLPPVLPLPLPQDRYGAALGSVPAESDACAQRLHLAAVRELEDLADCIRRQARTAAHTDHDGARAIEAAV